MRIGIAGGGAMGSLFAWYFHRAGIDVSVYEADNAAAESLKSGLSVTAEGRTDIITLSACSDPSILRDRGMIFLFVKSYSTGAAMRSIAPHLSPDAIIVSLQNGLGNREAIAAHVPAGRIVYGSTTIGAYKTAPHALVLGGMGDIVLGGTGSGAVDAVAEALRLARLPVTVTKRPDETIWRKAIINAGINPVAALLGIPNGKIIESEHLSLLQKNIVFEAAAAARALGIDLDSEAMAAATREICAKTAANRCSMLQDLDAGRPTEIDSINGMIIRYGREHRIDTPYNEAVYALIKYREQKKE